MQYKLRTPVTREDLAPLRTRSHMLLLSHVAADGVLNGAAQHGLDGLLEVLAVQHLAALLVDDLPLGVHHVIVLEHVFPAGAGAPRGVRCIRDL